MAFIELKDVEKSFGKVMALNGLSLSLEQGEHYAIQGASGSGKSTLLYLLGGLDRPTRGSVKIDSKNINDLDDDSLARYRNLFVGFVFQFHFLLPSMNCLDNIYLPSRLRKKSPETLDGDVEKLAQELGVSHCLSKFPFELSGGEQQRINIIRALSLRPRIILCDEPTGNLDSKNSSIVTDLLKGLATKYQSTLIVVTHDDLVAEKLQHRIVIKDGLIDS